MFRKKDRNRGKGSAPRSTGSGGRAQPSIVGHDLKFVGIVSGGGEIQFDGALEGELRSANLTVGENATITGAVAAETVLVRGAIKGTIRARSVRLEKTAKVVGDIYHEGLSIEDGAFIEGRCIPCPDALEGVDLAGVPEMDAHSRSNDNLDDGDLAAAKA